MPSESIQQTSSGQVCSLLAVDEFVRAFVASRPTYGNQALPHVEIRPANAKC